MSTSTTIEQVRATVEAAGLPFDALVRAPRSAAAFIKSNQNLTNGKTALRIAVLGAHIQDVACAGALYQLIPLLAGVPDLQLDVDLVGPDVCSDFANVDLTSLGLRPAAVHQMKVGRWWKSIPQNHRPDLVFVFHPGLEEHHSEWMRAGELTRVLKANIPTAIFSYDVDESQRDEYILRLHGAIIKTQPVEMVPHPNLSKFDLPKFGGACFSVRGFKKSSADVAGGMFAVKNLALALGESFVQNQVFMRHADMCKTQTVLRGSVHRNVMHLVSDLYLDAEKEELFRARNGAECVDCKPMPGLGLAAALQMQPSNFERALLVGEFYGLARLTRM